MPYRSMAVMGENQRTPLADSLCRTVILWTMNSSDRNNLIVMVVLGLSLFSVTFGYVLAWTSTRPLYRAVGCWMVAAVSSFAGVFILLWIITIPSVSVKDLAVALTVLSPLPIGAFYMSAKFVRRAVRGERK